MSEYKTIDGYLRLEDIASATREDILSETEFWLRDHHAADQSIDFGSHKNDYEIMVHILKHLGKYYFASALAYDNFTRKDVLLEVLFDSWHYELDYYAKPIRHIISMEDFLLSMFNRIYDKGVLLDNYIENSSALDIFHLYQIIEKHLDYYSVTPEECRPALETLFTDKAKVSLPINYSWLEELMTDDELKRYHEIKSKYDK